MTGFWLDPHPGEVVHLGDVQLERLPGMPPETLAVVVCLPSGRVDPRELLDHMERSALDLFPVWLPGAELLESAEGVGVAAVRALAHRLAATTSHHGPFLADLAERAMRAQPTSVVFPDAVRALPRQASSEPVSAR